MRLQPVRLKSRSVAVLAGSALAAAAAIVPAVAATPGSGSVSDTSPTATWTAGPFAVPNVTGQTGEVSCTAATPCDDYALSVDVPAGYDADHSLRVDVTWPDSAAVIGDRRCRHLLNYEDGDDQERLLHARGPRCVLDAPDR